ncbi:MAG: hypothetical protein HN436_07205 [Oceanospirillaceae bacterium]|jgi:hypothetical protein|nr:hypothetical protein [Oceanospirillaceae bacterium]
MSEFISVYDLLAGEHKDKCPGVKELATAIETGSRELFHFDRVGRYKKVTEYREREAILVVIAKHYEGISTSDFYAAEHYRFHFEDWDEGNIARVYGWPGELPDFEAIYAEWKVENGSGVEDEPELPRFVRQNNKAWDVLLGAVMHSISTMPEVNKLTEGRHEKIIEILDGILTKGQKSQYTSMLNRMVSLQKGSITNTTLRRVLKSVPEEVWERFRNLPLD